MRDSEPGPGELLLLEQGNHGCANVRYLQRQYSADWMTVSYRLMVCQAPARTAARRLLPAPPSPAGARAVPSARKRRRGTCRMAMTWYGLTSVAVSRW